LLRWKQFVLGLALALFLLHGLVAAAFGGESGRAEDRLSLWPEPARTQLIRLIDQFGGRTPRAFAVFDADNTIWRNDLEEALMPYLEARGRISLTALDKTLKPIEPIEGESLTSYYLRLYGLDVKISMPWVAQVFTGLSLSELRRAVKEMIRSGEATKTYVIGEEGRREIEVFPPKIYPAQAQLIRTLMAHGIEVYVVSAALEELVRMIVSDPDFGIGIPPENVIGVNLLLTGPGGSVTAGAMDRMAGKKSTAWYLGPDRMKLVLSTYLYSPGSWYSGKLAAIKEYIHPDQRPILVAGDAPNDHFMLFYCDAAAGGLRLFVRRKEAYWQRTQQAIRERSRKTGFGKADPMPDAGWLYLRPEELEGVRIKGPSPRSK